MKGITRAYLLYLINNCVSVTIKHKRKIKEDYFVPVTIEVTEEEIIDFFTTIPYFSVELKDFLMGNLNVQTIIISEAWEKDFVRKGITWATNSKWTDTDMSFLPNCYKDVIVSDFLSMPY